MITLPIDIFDMHIFDSPYSGESTFDEVLNPQPAAPAPPEEEDNQAEEADRNPSQDSNQRSQNSDNRGQPRQEPPKIPLSTARYLNLLCTTRLFKRDHSPLCLDRLLALEKVLHHAEEGDSCLKTLVHEMAACPNLDTLLIGTVNSKRFALSKRITSLHQALVTLGPNTFRQLVLVTTNSAIRA